MPSQSDRRERNEALRLFIAAAVALLLLIVVGSAGFYICSSLAVRATRSRRASGLRTRR